MFEKHLDALREQKRHYESKLGRLARPLQFVLVGSSGLVVDLACFAALVTSLPLAASRALAIWVAMSWNFWLNSRLTFSDSRKDSRLKQYVLFCLSCLCGALVNWSVSMYLGAILDYLLAALAGILAGTGFNYVFSVHVAFGRRLSSEDSTEFAERAPSAALYPVESD